MSVANRLTRSVVLCGLVCAALVATTAVAVAAASDPGPHLYAQERAYSSYGTADSSPALAQEQYLGSYGEPEPLSPPQSPLQSDDTPWLPIALAIAGALVIVAASGTQLRRLRVRRRRNPRRAPLAETKEERCSRIASAASAWPWPPPCSSQ